MMDNQETLINNTLIGYLSNKTYEKYSHLINTILQDGVPLKAKYNLWALLMNTSTKDLTIDSLVKRLKEVYLEDEDILSYLDKAIFYNPKLGLISINAFHTTDMEDNYSLSIDIPCKENQAAEFIIKIKEVLTMMLVETKTIKGR